MEQGNPLSRLHEAGPGEGKWILRQKEKRVRNRTIADSMNVSVRRVQELWSAYSATGSVPEVKRPGRRRVEPSDEEKGLIAKDYRGYRRGTVMLERVMAVIYGAVNR